MASICEELIDAKHTRDMISGMARYRELDMKDEFTRQARAELETLEEQRIFLSFRLDALTKQIAALSAYLEASDQDASSEPNSASLSPESLRPADIDSRKGRRRTGPRGRKMTTILSALRKSHPEGLNLDQIISRASDAGVELMRTSLRSQLSKAKSHGYIENVDGIFFYVPGPLESNKANTSG